MIPAVFFLVALATDNVNLVALLAIVVPVTYAFLAGVGELHADYVVNGGGRAPFRFYVDEDDVAGWTPETGDIDRLISLHQSGRTVVYVEPVWRLSLAPISSLGLDLALGAIAISLAWAIDGTAARNLVVSCLAFQIFLAFVSYFMLMSVKKILPNKRLQLELSAMFAIFLGIFAMFLSFAALEPRSVTTLLNLLP